jgi:hypothetical protein
MFNIFKKKRKVLVYDLAYVPEGWDVDTLFDIWKNEGILVYDTDKRDLDGKKIITNGCTPPYVIEI